MSSKKAEKFNRSMSKQKDSVDASIAQATHDKGLIVLLTGDGKGKTSSAFGMVMRAIPYQKKIAIVQFIKGTQASGEENFIREHFPQIDFCQMATGFTWDNQDYDKDKLAAERTWDKAQEHLNDATCNLVVLDELTYMLAYKFLEEDSVIQALLNRPSHQHVVITGRGGGRKLQEIADTVSEVKNIKHAYASGIKAQEGIDF